MTTFTHGRAVIEIGEHTATVLVDGELVATVLDNDQPITLHSTDTGRAIQALVALLEFENSRNPCNCRCK